MRQIVASAEQVKVVMVADLKPRVGKYYGAELTEGINGGRRAFITRKEYACGNFTLRCFDGLTNGNGWESFNSESLKDLIAELLEYDWEVYEFNTSKELLQWLLEEEI